MSPFKLRRTVTAGSLYTKAPSGLGGVDIVPDEIEAFMLHRTDHATHRGSPGMGGRIVLAL